MEDIPKDIHIATTKVPNKYSQVGLPGTKRRQGVRNLGREIGMIQPRSKKLKRRSSDYPFISISLKATMIISRQG